MGDTLILNANRAWWPYRQEACEQIVTDKLSELGLRVNESLSCPGTKFDGACITELDVEMLKEYECEYQRRGDFDVAFPGEDAASYLDLFMVPRRENHLAVWWHRSAFQL